MTSTNAIRAFTNWTCQHVTRFAAAFISSVLMTPLPRTTPPFGEINRKKNE